MPFSNRPLTGRRIVLADGAGFLANYIGDGIVAAGGQVLGPARSVEDANGLLRDLHARPDAAVICADIFDHAGFEHRDLFDRHGVPLLLITNHPRAPSACHDSLAAPFASFQIVDHICARLGLEPTCTQAATV